MSRQAELTLQLSPEIEAHLDQLAKATQRTRAELVQDALVQYLDIQRWQVEGIQDAIEEADRGEPGILHAGVAQWLDSWGSDEEHPPPEPDK